MIYEKNPESTINITFFSLELRIYVRFGEIEKK